MCARGVEERNTLRTSEESEAETKRPPIKKKIPGANLHQAKTDLHQVQILHVVGMDLHLMQFFVLSFPFCLGGRNKYRQYWLLR
jgi:hypothetical protein